MSLDNNTNDKQSNEDEQEIDILDITAKLWKARRKLLIWGSIGAIIGIVIAFSLPKEYSTTIKIAAESTESSMPSSLTSLAAMIGINIEESASDAVDPSLYPEVLHSVPFVVGLFDVKIHDQGSNTVYTIQNYLKTHNSKPWWTPVFALPYKVLALFKTPKPAKPGKGYVDAFNLTKAESGIYATIVSRIKANYDINSGVNTITVTMQDPVVSAMLADSVTAHLKDFITNYRTSKARQDLEYAKQLNEEARSAYYEAQQKYADYLDRNHGLSLHSAQVTRDRLQNEADLAFSLFNQTSQQLQLAKAKVMERTPVFVVLQPATVPLAPSKPNKGFIIFVCIFLSVSIVSAIVLYSHKLDELKQKLCE